MARTPSKIIPWMHIFGAALDRDIERMAGMLDEDPTLLNRVWRGMTLLVYAALRGDMEMVNFLLRSGADIHCKCEFGKTALMHASTRGHVAVVLLLLRHLGKSGLDERDDNGNTALMLACRQGQMEVVRVLLLAGADHTIATRSGSTLRQIAKDEDVTEVSDTHTYGSKVNTL
jgi:ankyrin repeat protein